jgi:hypothetical protein
VRRQGWRSLGCVLLLGGLSCNRIPGEDAPHLPRPTPEERAAVSVRLNAMVAADQSARRGHQPVAEIDRRNTDELKNLYRRYGWFNITTWGAEADRNAWLLVQHTQDLAFMKEILSVLERLRHRRETNPGNYAYLHDRVAFMIEIPNGGAVMSIDASRRQRYGTQGHCNNGRWEPFPLEQPARVDQLRASVGLGPLDEYRNMFRCK